MSRPQSQPGNFTHQADAYAHSRPTYPHTILDRLIAHAGVQPGDAVVDLGAGTGIATRPLAERGFSVTAVEPNAAMRQQAEPLENVNWVNGTFEDLPLPDGSQRWALSAQAFHWADVERALPEVRRVLQPGGCLTVIWNNRDMEANDILRQTRQIILEVDPDYFQPYRKRDWSEALTSTGDFADVACHEDHHVHRMAAEDYMRLWRSINRLATNAGSEGVSQVAERVEALLRQTGDEHVDVPYRTRAWTARRVG